MSNYVKATDNVIYKGLPWCCYIIRFDLFKPSVSASQDE